MTFWQGHVGRVWGVIFDVGVMGSFGGVGLVRVLGRLVAGVGGVFITGVDLEEVADVGWDGVVGLDRDGGVVISEAFGVPGFTVTVGVPDTPCKALEGVVTGGAVGCGGRCFGGAHGGVGVVRVDFDLTSAPFGFDLW